ncbi:MAG: hypothetical protein HY775_13650 [Acidobacteria bacterium]|nr:hypothetical protein [Acidobacteriota bacterium]
MRYQRTQIYLDPEHHRALVADARRRGISLAALMREVVASHVREQAPSYETKSFDAIIGIIDGEPTDVAAHFDEYLGEALDALDRKKMGVPPEKGRRRTRDKG